MPSKHYKKNYLTRVILRANIEPIPALQTQERLEFSDRVKEHFPVVAGIPVGNLVVNVAPTGSGVQQEITGMQWEHRKVQGGTSILFLTPDHLSLEYGQKDFDHFPPFRKEFEAAFNVFVQLYPDARVTRLGLRYVNQVRLEQGNPLDWEGLVEPSLIAAVKAGLPHNASLARSMHQIVAKKDNLNVQLHYGIFNPEFPAPLARRDFVIDIDCYRDELIPSNEVLSTVIALNEMCEARFEACISDGLRALMEPIQ